MLEQILALVRAVNLEVIRSRPLRSALNLVPTIQYLLDHDPFPLPQKTPRCLVRLMAGVTLNLDGNELHNLILTFGAQILLL